jgi:hypothetical protein
MRGIGTLPKETLIELAKAEPHEEDHCWKCGKFINTQTWIGIFCDECNEEFEKFESAKRFEKQDWDGDLPENDHERLIAEFILEDEKVILT